MAKVTCLMLAALIGWSGLGAGVECLTVERMENPVGLDVAAPRLGWRLPVGATRQSAYEIECNGRSSGRIASARQVDVSWPFARPRSSERFTWRVRAWDDAGRDLGWSAPATFVAGIMAPGDWQAKWIAQNPVSRPTADLGLARWVQTDRLDLVVDCRDATEVCDLAFAATALARVELDGRLFYKPNGHTYDHRFPMFLNLTGRLKPGPNTLSIIFDDQLAASWTPPRTDVKGHAVIAAVRFRSGRRAWSQADKGQKDLGSQYEPDFAKSVDWREETHSPAFAKTFEVTKPVRRATLHISGLGYYEASLNGEKVGDKELDPIPTDYDDRVLYSTYVLDGKVRPGRNSLKILLGHGWWDVRSYTSWDLWRAAWRSYPRTIAQLELEYADGTRGTVVTDASWCEAASPVWWDCLREGVVLGAPRRLAAELPVVEAPAPKGALECEKLPATKVVKEIRPSEIRETASGDYVVRFPETLSGWTRIRFTDLEKGDVVHVSYEENLTPRGERPMPCRPNPSWTWTDQDRLIDMFFDHSASYRFTGAGGAFQTDHYHALGTGDEVYEPRFVYHGFNAVILSGLRQAPRAEDIVARYVRTDFRTVGAFASSDPTLDALVGMAQNSYRVNFTNGFPTDCPHREKLGWTGDTWIASELGNLFFENTAAYRKWLQDIIDTQRADGSICSIAPTGGWGYKTFSGPVFDAALAAIPWNLYRYRGDRGAVELAYPALWRYLAFEKRQVNEKGLVANGLGDWNCPDRSVMPALEYVASCAYLYMLELADKMARLLGKADDARQVAADAAALRRALVKAYYKGNGRFDNGGQTAQALAVVLDLVPEADRAAAGRLLAEACSRPIEHGLAGAKVVNRALSKIGRDDLALKLILRKEPPSPGYWVGKTSTLWEDYRFGQSKAHVMLGDFAAWAVECLAGLRVESVDRYVIRPSVSSGLTKAAASTETPFGKLAVAWTRDSSGRYEITTTVPPGTTAKIVFPTGGEEELSPGTRTFVR